MRYVHLNCDNCGSPIKFEPGRQSTFCPSCGTQVFKEGTYDKNSVEALIMRAESHLSMSNISQAIKAYEELSDVYPYLHYGWEGLIRIMTNDYKTPIKYSDIKKLNSYMERVKKTAPEEEYKVIKNKYITYAKSISLQLASEERREVQRRMNICTRSIGDANKLFNEDKKKYNDFINLAHSKEDYLKYAYETPVAIKKYVCWAGVALFIIALIYSIIAGKDIFNKLALFFGTSIPGTFVFSYGVTKIQPKISKQEYEEGKRVIENSLHEGKKLYDERSSEYNKTVNPLIKKQNAYSEYLSFDEDQLTRQVFHRFMQFDSNMNTSITLDIGEVLEGSLLD